MLELNFNLNVVDNWPPVSKEALPCTKIGDKYRIEAVPLFIKGLSIGDILEVRLSEISGMVDNWKIVEKSGNSTIWLLRLKGNPDIESKLEYLKFLGCNTASLTKLGCYAISVPKNCFIDLVDHCLDELDENMVGIAYPSFRHE